MLSHACPAWREAWHWAGAAPLSYPKLLQESLQEGTQAPAGLPSLHGDFGAHTCSGAPSAESSRRKRFQLGCTHHQRATALLPWLPLGGNFSPAFIKTNTTLGGLVPAA